MITIEKNFNKKHTFADIDYFISSIVDNMEYKIKYNSQQFFTKRFKNYSYIFT